MLRKLAARFPFLVSSGYAALTASSAALLLVLLTIAGRLLSTADYGRFSYALALTTIVEMIMDIGLGSVTVRGVARDRDSARHFFPNVLGLKLVWVAVGLSILAIVTPLLRSDPQVVTLCYVMGFPPRCDRTCSRSAACCRGSTDSTSRQWWSSPIACCFSRLAASRCGPAVGCSGWRPHSWSCD